MEVYNKEKTQIISDYDLSKGRLERDERTIYHEAVKEVVEQFHYEVVKEYENGGKDVEKVVDVKGVPGRDAYEETEDIYVFIPYTDEELKKKGCDAYYFPSFEEIENFCLTHCQKGDVLITMGAGDVVNIGEHLLGK